MIGRISTLFLSPLLFLSCPIVIMSGECEYPLCIFAHNHLVLFGAVFISSCSFSYLVHCDHVCEVWIFFQWETECVSQQFCRWPIWPIWSKGSLHTSPQC
jgi:hypothetical protein